MEVIGFSLLSNSSANRKHYTFFITDTGYQIVHYGASKFDILHDIIKPAGGTYDSTLLKDESIQELFDYLNIRYTSKANKLEYDVVCITKEPITLEDHGFISQSNVSDIFDEFFDALHPTVNPKPSKSIDRYVENLNVTDLSTYRHMINKFKFLLLDDEESYENEAELEEQQSPGGFYTDIEEETVVRPNGEVYRPREINGHTDVSLLREFRKRKMFVRLAGPPGGGKTALAEAAFGEELITVSGHGDATVANFVGTWMPRANKQEGESEWQYIKGPLTRAMENGLPFFVDEATRFSTEVLNILFSACDGRGILRIDERPDIEPVHAKEGFYVLLGYNPETLGAKPLDEALTSRFGIMINVETDYDTARTLGIPEKIIKVAEELAAMSKLFKDQGNIDGVWVPQMRELIYYRDIINAGVGEDFALSTLVAACPRPLDVPILVTVIQESYGKSVSVPSLGGLV